MANRATASMKMAKDELKDWYNPEKDRVYIFSRHAIEITRYSSKKSLKNEFQKIFALTLL